MQSLTSDFNNVLNSIDAGLDNASKLIHESQQYVTKPTTTLPVPSRTSPSLRSSPSPSLPTTLPKERLNGHSPVRLRQACKKVDSDGDGQLTKNEFTRVLSDMGIPISTHEANQLCSRYNDTTSSNPSNFSRTTLPMQKDHIDYNSFVRSLTKQPLRSPTSIARDAAKHIYKHTGIASHHLAKELRKEDKDCTGTLTRQQLKQQLSIHGANVDPKDMQQMLSMASHTPVDTPDDNDHIDYVHLTNALQRAEEMVAVESERRVTAENQWWRRVESDTKVPNRRVRKASPRATTATTATTRSNDAPTTTIKSPVTLAGTVLNDDPSASRCPSPVVYNNNRMMRGLNGRPQHQRASPHMLRSDILRPQDPSTSTMSEKQQSATGHTSNKLEYVTQGRIVEKCAA